MQNNSMFNVSTLQCPCLLEVSLSNSNEHSLRLRGKNGPRIAVALIVTIMFSTTLSPNLGLNLER